MSEIRVDLITEKTADGGVTIKSTGTGDNKPTLLTLQTSEADIAANDVLGKIQFQAPDEGTGTDAILVSAAIQARSEGDFAADANATAIDFMVGASEAAATKMSLSSTGVLTAVELDISGNVDVDGTTNLDVVDIDGAVNMATTALVTGVLTTTATTVFNGGFTSNDGCVITTADNTDSLTLISTDADANVGPILRLYRNSASPADNDVLGRIAFHGLDDNNQEEDLVKIEAIFSDVSNGSEDGSLNIDTKLAGTLRSRIEMLPTETVFNEDSIDLDFRVESNGNANMFIVNGGNNLVGIGADPDLGAGLHIKIADSGATATAHGDELVIEDGTSGANVGISILCNANGEGRINFGDSDDNDIGGIYYEHDGDRMEFVVNNASQFTISGSTSVTTLAIVDDEIASGGETAPDVGTGGLTLNQGSSDNKILTAKSSDVAHGMTSIAETDTYAYMQKGSGDAGGLQLDALAEGTDAFTMHAYQTTTNTAKSTSADAAIMFKARKKSSASAGSLSDANANIMAIADHNTRRFLFDIEGDFHADSSSTTFDTYEDAQLVRAYDLSHGKGVINSQFDKYVQYQHEDLADAGLVGREDDGTPNHFINVTGFQRLHNGAIWQQYEKHQRLAKAVYELAKVAVGEDKANEILEQNEIKLLN